MDNRFDELAATEDGPRYALRGSLGGHSFTVAAGYTASHDGWCAHCYAARRPGFSEQKISEPTLSRIFPTKEAAHAAALDTAFEVISKTLSVEKP